MAVAELVAAERYWKLHESRAGEMFRTMAKHNLSHAAALANHLSEQGKSQDSGNIKMRLQQLEKIIK